MNETIQGPFNSRPATRPTATQAVQVTTVVTLQPTFSDPAFLEQLEQGVVGNATPLDQTMPWWLNLLLASARPSC